MFRSLNKDGAVFFSKKPPRHIQYPGRPLGSRVLLPSRGHGLPAWSFSPPRSIENAHPSPSESGGTD